MEPKDPDLQRAIEASIREQQLHRRNQSDEDLQKAILASLPEKVRRSTNEEIQAAIKLSLQQPETPPARGFVPIETIFSQVAQQRRGLSRASASAQQPAQSPELIATKRRVLTFIRQNMARLQAKNRSDDAETLEFNNRVQPRSQFQKYEEILAEVRSKKAQLTRIFGVNLDEVLATIKGGPIDAIESFYYQLSIDDNAQFRALKELLADYAFMIKNKINASWSPRGNGLCFWSCFWKHCADNKVGEFGADVRGPASLRFSILMKFLTDDRAKAEVDEHALNYDSFITYIEHITDFANQIQDALIDNVAQMTNTCLVVYPLNHSFPLLDPNLLCENIDTRSPIVIFRSNSHFYLATRHELNVRRDVYVGRKEALMPFLAAFAFIFAIILVIVVLRLIIGEIKPIETQKMNAPY